MFISTSLVVLYQPVCKRSCFSKITQRDIYRSLIYHGLSPAFHCGGNARGNTRVIKRTRPVPDSCVSMEAFSARVSAPVFDDLCVHLDLPRVYKCEMVSFQLMLTKNRARFTFTSGNSDIVSKFFFFPRAETREWKRFNGKGSMCFCASEVSARGNAGVSAAMESGTNVV